MVADDMPYLGKWKAQKGSAAGEIEFVPSGSDGLTVKGA